jgi:hypothetical protein
MARLQTFATDTHPLIRELRPVARDLRPTLHDVRLFAPDLKRTFQNLDPLIVASRTGLPALRDTLKGTGPVLEQLTPFLGNLNPILEYFEVYQHQVADFISNGAGALVDTEPLTPEAKARGEIGHYLRQNGPGGAESVAMYNERPRTERGNSYLGPTSLGGRTHAFYDIFPSWDCANVDNKTFRAPEEPGPDYQDGPSCWTETLPGQSGPGQFPHVQAKDYLKQSARR